MEARWVVVAIVIALAVAIVAASVAALAQVGRAQRPRLAPIVEAPSADPVTGRGWLRGFARRGFFAVEVSEEFASKVVSILQSDQDAAKLLSEGYNVTAIRPVIALSVTGDGSVTLRASQAVVTLRKDASWAVVRVDVAKGKVISITVVTRIVIEKQHS